PGDRDRARHAAELHREQTLVVSPLRAAAVVALAALLLAPSARAAENPRLRRDQAVATFLGYGKGAGWLKRYPPKPTTDASFKSGTWTVNVWAGAAGEIATGKVDDATGTVLEAWTGPQVAWNMARGAPGAFGGQKINSLSIWLAFCGVFLIGLVDWRRILSVRNLDLLMLL